MTKNLSLIFFAFMCIISTVNAQLSITATNTNYTIDFDNTISGVNNGVFEGTGWHPNPQAGQLDSNAWGNTGMSDGPLTFGGTQTSNDFARGIEDFGVNSGGWYSFNNVGNGVSLGFQPGSSDMTPGSLTLKIQNNSGDILTELSLEYDIVCFNDQPRANSFNFSHSSDNLTFTNESSLDYTSPKEETETITTTNQNITITNLSIPVGGFYYLRWSTDDVDGSGSRDEFAIDNIVLSSISCTDSLDYYAINNDPNPVEDDDIQIGEDFFVKSQAYEFGVTEANGAGNGIEVWVGYIEEDLDAGIDETYSPANSGWNWQLSNYIGQTGSGFNDDLYQSEIGSALPTGTYYYVSRFRLNGCGYTYSGLTPIWNNNSVKLQIKDQVNFLNVQSPKSATRNLCESVDIYAQVEEPGVTPGDGQGPNIDVWIGYIEEDLGNGIGENYAPNEDGWTWVPASYNDSCLNCNVVNGVAQNDEYYVSLGNGLPPGTYYFASRSQLNGDEFSYGGIQSDGVGNFWSENSFNNGTLTINAPVEIEGIVITEIMYDSPGFDDEWIEICNESDSAQDLSLSQIKVNDGLVFTFPCNTTISEGACITISLGSNGDGVYNNDCEFTPNFGVDADTNDTNYLINSSATITILASDNTTVIDSVTYNNEDGADGNGSSLHVINATLDNSSTSTNWQEVELGGSSGVFSSTPNCLPNEAIILVEGNLGTFPDITNGDTTPTGTNNTLFSSQFVGSSQTKSYRISSLGLIDISISSIDITGDNTDFTVTSNPSDPIIYGSPQILEVTFSPTSPGEKNATVVINNNDNDDNPFSFAIKGDGLCIEGNNTISPSSGPAGTIVTVTGTNLLNATAELNESPLTVTNISDSEMELIIPDNAETGNISIYDDTDCTSVVIFNVIDKALSSCEGSEGNSPTELFISEVTDATYYNLTYVELYNGTGSAINLENYTIEVINNGKEDPEFNGSFSLENYTLSSGETYVVALGMSANTNEFCTDIDGGSGELASSASAQFIQGSINKKDDGHDFIRLLKNDVPIDAFGVYQDNSWMDDTIITGDRGFNFRRSNTASSLPSNTFNLNDWDIIDWVGSGQSSCAGNDYSDIGLYDFSIGTPPVVSTQPNALSDICAKTASISVSGQEGFNGGKTITYQWYYTTPGDSGWTEVIDNDIYSGATASTLEILDIFDLDNYQYYCQIREDDVACFTASRAVRLTLKKSTWNGDSWLPWAPSESTIAVISDDYNTSENNSFSACQLFVNSGAELRIDNDTYVEIQNDLYVEGEVTIENSGALVQINEASQVFGDGEMKVNKLTSTLETVYDYIYWSSPVENPEIWVDALEDANPNRTFWHDAKNFSDRYPEIGNSGNFDLVTDLNDDIDDDGNDWQYVQSGDVMITGRGYASNHSPSAYTGSDVYPYEFSGKFNTGSLTTDLFKNNAVTDDTNWNLVGNPYPSSINVEDFFNENSFELDNDNNTIEGIICIWYHRSPPSSSNSGNSQINFANDYIRVNAIGAVVPGDDIEFNGHIASGQAFLVALDEEALSQDIGNSNSRADLRFTNAMRRKDNNNMLYRTSSQNESDKVWFNLTGDEGLFSQTLIAYAPNASALFDGALYDARHSYSTDFSAMIYTVIEDDPNKFMIQAKGSSDLSLEEIIPLAFDTNILPPYIYTLSIDKFEGEFMTTEPIYVYDALLGITHNLKTGDYHFTSEEGAFPDRFSIVFSEAALSINEIKQSSTSLTITNGVNKDYLNFNLSGNSGFKRIELFDLLGRLVYSFEASGYTTTKYLPQIKSGAFIARVTLTNGLTISKKAIKQ